MFKTKNFLLICLVLFVCSTSLIADVIHFKDGRKIEGQILSQDSEKIKVKTKFGTKEFLLTEIEKIEKKETVDEKYKNKVKNLDTTDIDAVIELVLWCKENKKEKEARKHLKEIIKLDPNNEKARELLGYTMYEGAWKTESEIQALEEAKARKEKEAQGLVEYNGEWIAKEDMEHIKAGLVKYEGEWVTPEVKERRENNLVLYEGQWVPEEDVEKLEQGLFKVDGNWLTKDEADKAHSTWENPWVLKSEHLKILTNKNYDYGQRMLADGEYAYKHIKGIANREPDLSDTLITLYVLASIDDYNEIGNQIGDEKSSLYNVFYAPETNEDGPVSATYCRTDPVKGDTDNFISYSLGLIRHGVSVQYLMRLDENDEIPNWFKLGQAAKIDKFWHEGYISYYIKRLNGLGGFIKTSQFFDIFGFSEQEIFVGGLICAYMESKDVSDSVKQKYEAVKAALVSGEKISSSFNALEKSIMKAEKKIRAYLDNH